MEPRKDDPLLSNRELAGVVLAVLPIFFFLGGPIWRHAYAIDAAVFWSYAPIPILVVLLLLRRGVLSFAGLVVNTMSALLVKYLVTSGIALGLWFIFEPPPVPAPAAAVEGAGPRRPKAAPAVPMGTPVEVALDAHAPPSGVVIVQKGHGLVFHSRDHALHTVRATRADGLVLFHRPVLPGRDSEPVVLAEDVGSPVVLSCAVHEHEPHRTLLVEGP